MMKTTRKLKWIELALFGLVLSFSLALSGCTDNGREEASGAQNDNPQETTGRNTDVISGTPVSQTNSIVVPTSKCTGDGPVCGAFCDKPTISSQLPGPNPCAFGQKSFNCYAWRCFMALNWAADPNAPGTPDTSKTATDFGTPGDYSPVVWETFKDVKEVFQDHPPAPWGVGNQDAKHCNVPGCEGLRSVGNLSKGTPHTVTKLQDKQHNIPEPDGLVQATGQWLTDVDGNLIWYELKMNRDEFEFIYKNKLYDPEEQYNYAEQNKGLWLPLGPTEYGEEGAMEIKSAWRIIPDDSVEILKNYYKITRACVARKVEFPGGKFPPKLSDFQPTYLGLVGLHIVRRVEGAPQLVWMTFESVFNTITKGDNPEPGVKYNLYNPHSTAQPNVPPKLTDPTDRSVQVVRENRISKVDACPVTAYCHDLIRKANPKSVWQYYELVNVEWPGSAVSDDINNEGRTPLHEGGIRPNKMANTTMETYVQTTKNCMNCHRNAPISSLYKESDHASSYSFLFIEAKKQKK